MSFTAPDPQMTFAPPALSSALADFTTHVELLLMMRVSLFEIMIPLPPPPIDTSPLSAFMPQLPPFTITFAPVIWVLADAVMVTSLAFAVSAALL
ncbi:hypothetical protein BE15_17280 [Sorangium cellulosum]|uniref:Uncharacterized protein n=1 Tax=Sorangium cellulosum TaxID=56 RepID=A0A150QY94_SORCE|nr:hypothetical protein BE15_17280 [Sorangium cellulosum]